MLARGLWLLLALLGSILLVAACSNSGGGGDDEDDTADDDSGDDDDTDDDDDDDADRLEVELPSGVTVAIKLDDLTQAALDFPLDDLTLEQIDSDSAPAPTDIQDLGEALIEIGPDAEYRGVLLVSVAIPDGLIPAEHSPGMARYDEERGLWVPLAATFEPGGAGIDQVLSVRVPRSGMFGIYSEQSQYSKGAGDGLVASVYLRELSASNLTIEAEFNKSIDARAILSGPGIAGGDEEHAIDNAPEWNYTLPEPDEGKYLLEIVRGSFFSGAVLEWSQDIRIGGAEDPVSGPFAYLAQRFAPVLAFHPDEEYCPIPLDDSYFEEARVWHPMTGDVALSGSALADYLARRGDNRALIQDEDDSAWAARTCDPSDDAPTVYWQAQQSDDFIFLTYWLFFSRDPKDRESGFWSHDRDRESVTVVLNESDRSPAALLFFGHLDWQTLSLDIADGPEWKGMLALPWSSVDLDCTGRHPVVYLAEGSHAIYPREGTYEIEFSIFTDTEEAGGGALACPASAYMSGSPLGECATTYAADDLRPLGVGDDLAYDNEWQHLAFSGDWVDLPGWGNEGFPPFVERFDSVPEWNGATSNQADKFREAVQHGCGAEDEVIVPAGTFYMGCEPEDTTCIPDELPRHEVQLSAYYIDIYEVTNAQYADYLNNINPSNICGDYYACAYSMHPAYLGLYKSGGAWYVDSTYEDRPVVNVTWYGAKGYCEAQGKRLPTEAEWEKAAKGASQHYIYPWGDLIITNAANDYWNNDPYESGIYPWTTPVGYFDGSNHGGAYQTTDGRSPYGAHDMVGNVWEWVSDWYQGDYYSQTPPGGWIDPQGPTSGTTRVVRGGGWSYDEGGNLRTSQRWALHQSSWNYGYFQGFRCARDAE